MATRTGRKGRHARGNVAAPSPLAPFRIIVEKLPRVPGARHRSRLLHLHPARFQTSPGKSRPRALAVAVSVSGQARELSFRPASFRGPRVCYDKNYAMADSTSQLRVTVPRCPPDAVFRILAFSCSISLRRAHLSATGSSTS